MTDVLVKEIEMLRDNQLTRRDAIKTGTLGAASIALAGCFTQAARARAKESPKTEGWIDAHSHIWTRDVENFPLAEGQTVDDLKPASFTAEELIETARGEGVDRVVLIQHHIYHGWDNSYLVGAATRFPDKFRVVGMVDDTKTNPGNKMRMMLKYRVTAFRITSLIRGGDNWLTGDGMSQMWRTGAETQQAMCCLINPEDTIAVDGMCQRFPDTPVVIDHFARIGMTGEIAGSDLDNLCRLARHKNTSVKISAYYALGQKQPPYTDMIPMIRRLLDVFGPERLMWASDSPYQIDGDHTYGASIGLIRDRLDGLSDGDREWLLCGTAKKVFFYDVAG